MVIRKSFTMQTWISEEIESHKPKNRSQSEWYAELMVRGLREWQKKKGKNKDGPSEIVTRNIYGGPPHYGCV